MISNDGVLRGLMMSYDIVTDSFILRAQIFTGTELRILDVQLPWTDALDKFNEQALELYRTPDAKLSRDR